MPSNTPVPKTPDQILQLALEKETMARDLYASLAAHCPVDFVRELLLQLQLEESKHMQLVKNTLGKLGTDKPLV